MIVLALALIKLLLSGPDLEGPRPAVDVLHYRFELSLSDSSNAIHGRTGITVHFSAPVDSFYLDLTSSDGRTGMEVTGVSVDGAPAAFRHERDRLVLAGPEDRQDSLRIYEVEYRGVPRDGLVISVNKFGERCFFGENWPNRARHWLPTVDHPADKATVEWVVTVPEHYDVVANGALIGRSSAGTGLTVSHWRTNAPIPTKVMVIGVARFEVQTISTTLGVPIENWLYPHDLERGVLDFAGAAAMLYYFHDRIGTYPYAKLANVESTTRYGGMENASAIFYPEQSITGRNLFEATVAHEIAHQWFGDSVTEGDWHHVWLSEGFANYFANLYWEEAYGRDAMERRLDAERNAVLNYHSAFPDSRVVDTRISDPNDLLTPNVYQKGGWILHMLRNEIGDESFWNGIRLYYRRFRDGNAVTADLRSVMEEVSGRDLDRFFDQWVFRPGVPVISGSWGTAIETGAVALILRQEQAEPFDVQLEVGITMRGGEKLVRSIRLTESLHQFDLHVGREVRHVELDPNTNLLFRNDFGR